METRPLVSVIFSFRNEEAVLEELIRRTENVFACLAKEPLKNCHSREGGNPKSGSPIKAFGDDTGKPYEAFVLDYELIFVNDASTDRSMEILLAAAKKNPNIRILQMVRCFGVMPCFMAGFDYAKGDAVIMMDCDLQDPPELIPALLKEWEAGAGVVHTVRTKRRGETFLKQAVTALGYRIWKLLLPVDLILDSGDFRLLSRVAVQEIIKQRVRNPFFRVLTRKLPFKQSVVPYERDPRYAGQTHFSWFRSLEPFKIFFSAFFPVLQIPDKPLYSISSCHGFPDD